MDCTVRPRLVVDDPASAIAFYRRAFAAREVARHTEPSGLVVHLELSIGTSTLSLVEAHEPYRLFSPTTVAGTPVLLTVAVENADRVRDTMLTHGGCVVVPVEDRPWAKREGRVQDPFGHLWILSQDL